MDQRITNYIELFSDPAQRVGATYVEGEGTYIRLWAPKVKQVRIEWLGKAPVALKAADRGYFTGLFPDAKPGDRYWFHADDRRIADPASRFQPEDTDGPSAVVDQRFAWQSGLDGPAHFDDAVIYEIHPGTYSGTHDFKGIIDDLPRLADLGVTMLEIMPVSQYSGDRNWGYDGVFPHAVQHSYGGPDGLKALVDACHRRGLSIILDVVYNHLGPENNMLYGCAPYAQDKYHTPWGDALNYDGAGSDDVRRYFLQAAWQWLVEFRLDGMRLDAVQTILDTSPVPFLEELARLKGAAEAERGCRLFLSAETDMNDPRLLAEPDHFGFGMDAHWADDLHHCLHVTLTGDNKGYFQDYGGLEQLARVYRDGVAYAGTYSPYRNRHHGRSYAGIDKRRLIVETQNHDQVGNRIMGDRLTQSLSFDQLKLAAGCVLLSPFTPFIFMGEEFASDAPFTYFVSHKDEKLMDMVRKGRAEEWKDFEWDTEPPDPGAEETFASCVLYDKQNGERGAAMFAWYKALIALSKRLRMMGEPEVELDSGAKRVILNYGETANRISVLLSFGADQPTQPQGRLLLDSHDFKAKETVKNDQAAKGDWSVMVVSA